MGDPNPSFWTSIIIWIFGSSVLIIAAPFAVLVWLLNRCYHIYTLIVWLIEKLFSIPKGR